MAIIFHEASTRINNFLGGRHKPQLPVDARLDGMEGVTPIPVKDEEKVREKIVDSTWGECLEEFDENGLERVDLEHFSEAFCLYNVFSEEECEALVTKAEESGFGKTNFPQKYRGNLRLQNDDPQLAALLFERIRGQLPETIEMDDDTWHLMGLNTRFRNSKYYPGTVFEQHTDASFLLSLTEQSFFTVNIYMNEGFEGGHTRFFKNNELKGDVTPVTGMALIFRQPPGQNYQHDGERVLSGLKYLLRTDVMYSK